MKLETSGLTCMAGLRALFRNCEFSIATGEWLKLSGANGTGKTTLLRALAGLVRPHSGQIHWQAEPVDTHSADWRGQIHYLGHSAATKDVLSVSENLSFWLALDSGARPSAETVRELLNRVGLASRHDLIAARLSAGQRKRLQLARLMARRSVIWLLDEPANALDTGGVGMLCELLEKHLAGGGIALVATHEALPVQSHPLALDMSQFAANARAQH